MNPYHFVYVDDQKPKANAIADALKGICEVEKIHFIDKNDRAKLEQWLSSKEPPPFSLLGLDLHLPGGGNAAMHNGLEYLYRFRRRFPWMEIIIISNRLEQLTVAKLVDVLSDIQSKEYPSLATDAAISVRAASIPSAYWLERPGTRRGGQREAFEAELRLLVERLVKEIQDRENKPYDCAIILDGTEESDPILRIVVAERNTQQYVHVELNGQDAQLFRRIASENREFYTKEYLEVITTRAADPADVPRQRISNINAVWRTRVTNLMRNLGAAPPPWMIYALDKTNQKHCLIGTDRKTRWLNAANIGPERFALRYGSQALYKMR